FLNCSSDDQEPVITYVSKLFSVPQSALSQNKQKPLTAEDIAQRRELLKQKQQEKITASSEESANRTEETNPTTTDNSVTNTVQSESNENVDE
ncbi:unnamed protein product, partial [Rotaria magnacalcarata]